MDHVNRINKIVFHELGPMQWLGIKSKEDINPEHHLVNDLGADSLDLIEMLMWCEEEFDVEVSDADAEKWHTVGDVYKYFE